jgi:hypothetical protein
MAELPARNSDEDKNGEEAEDNLDADQILRRRQEKGKAVVNAENLINIRVKVSDREETPLKVTISKEDNARIVALKILEEASVRLPSHPRDLKLITCTAPIITAHQNCLHGQDYG